MGSAAEYICEKCGWKTTINMRQPDCGFMGECLEKYCPITDQIIWILLGIGDKYDIGCQNKENDIPAEEQHLSCKNCTAEHAFFDIISSSAFGNKLKAIADIYLILSSMNDESSPVASSKIQPAVNYIANNFTNDISVALLAKLCFISESQLRRLFNRDMGVSPTMYKNRLLTLLAQKLLKSNDYPISEISLMLGFSNIYSFSHFFKRETGQSPTEYKKSNGI